MVFPLRDAYRAARREALRTVSSFIWTRMHSVTAIDGCDDCAHVFTLLLRISILRYDTSFPSFRSPRPAKWTSRCRDVVSDEVSRI